LENNNTREQEVQKKLKKDNGVVYMEKKIYVLNNRKIQEQILQENHGLADVEHPEQQMML